MMGKATRLLLGFVLLTLCGCPPPGMKYGFLPGGNYEFFAPTKPIDLHQKHIHYFVTDSRNEFASAECSEESPDRDSELEGPLGLDFFSGYLAAFTDSCNGASSGRSDTLQKTEGQQFYVDLQLLAPKFSGFISVSVHGMVQFRVRGENSARVYCSDMQDGDHDAPYGKFSFATRASAMRGMVAASCRRAIEQFLTDVSNGVFDH